MNDNAKKWVKALRSGDYKQGHGRLRTDDTFCCLGVACDLYAQEHPEAKWTFNYEVDWFYPLGYSDQGGSFLDLPKKVQEWVNSVSNIHSANQKPLIITLRSVIWKIDGKDEKGKTFSKQIRIDLPV